MEPPLELIDALRRGPLGIAPLAGSVLGPYVVEAPVARGGMGAVLRARDRRDGRTVALKLLLAGAAASDTQRRRFARECELVRGIEHPGVVRLFDHGEQSGVGWLALEYVAGGTLRDRLGCEPAARSLETLVQVAAAVGAAHRAGVVHRDLKPENVLLHADGRPVVSDFGLARDTAVRSSLTAEGSLLGTPHYMAPEQFDGREATPATDVWALGVMAYEALAGRLPFDGGDAGLMGLYSQVTGEPPPALPAATSPELRRVVLRALEKDPAARQPDASALAADLEAALAAPAPRRLPAHALGGALALLALALAGGLGWGLTRAARGASASAPSPAAPTASPASPAPPATHELELRPGPLAGEDSYVRDDGLYANDNFGANSLLIVGDRHQGITGDFRALLRFDLSALPADAALEAAVLELTVVDALRQTEPLELRARPLLAPFREGTTTHDEDLDGTAWDGDLAGQPYPKVSSRRPDLTQPEAGPQVASARCERGAARFQLDLTVAARAWLATPARNFGLRLEHAPEGPPYGQGYVCLASSDHPDAALRPALRLRYRGGPPAPAPDPAPRLAAARAEARRLLAPLATERDLAARARLAQRAVERAPFLGDALLARGWVRLDQGRVGAALVELALARDCLDPAPTRALRLANAWAELGLKRLDGAEAEARALLAEREDADALALAAALRLVRGDAAGARALIARGQALEPGHLRLAALAQQLGR
ncbi:MAG: protein kinase [Planctomycetota bacterium]